VESVSFGDEVELILPRTGFYLEAGGQVSDTGYIRSAPAANEEAWEIEIGGVRRPSAGLIVHVGEVISGQPRVTDRAVAEVDMVRRHDIMRNHTATHLLHAALHQVLGPHARQAGSLVAPDRLRFDFNHPEAMTAEQVEQVEQIVNDAVAADMEVTPKLKSREDAIAGGAMALFGEKYGETVRTISIAAPSGGPGAPGGTQMERPGQPMAVEEGEERYSYELCGGTHLERTSDVGAFLIVSEGSAAAGIRRIEAVTGRGAYELIARRFRALKQAASTLKASVDEVPQKIEDLQTQLAEARKEVGALRAQQALAALQEQMDAVQTVGDVHLLAAEIPGAGVEALRMLSDKFREKYPQNGAAVLVSGGLVISVLTEDLVRRGLKAGDLITAIGGRGGGRPNLAQGSLSNGLKTGELYDRAATVLREKLK
jgi:alanyl-tRNA synthetase